MNIDDLSSTKEKGSLSKNRAQRKVANQMEENKEVKYNQKVIKLNDEGKEPLPIISNKKRR